MTDFEVIEFWGSANLHRWPAAELTAVPLPEEVKQYLCEVGLPVRQDWTLAFGPDTPPPPLEVSERFFQVGSDYDVPVCLDLSRQCEVVVLEPDSPFSIRFVNSSLRALGKSLCAYQTFRLTSRGLDDDAITQLVEVFESTMLTIDPRSLAAETYWGVILEEMRYALPEATEDAS